GWQGEDVGAGWVACFSQSDVVFYDNFSDQNDDGWIVEEQWPGQVEVEQGEYSFDSFAGAARSTVAGLDIEHLEYTVWMKPLEMITGGETSFHFRAGADSDGRYEVTFNTAQQRGRLVRMEHGIGCTLAEFDCPLSIDAWHRLTVTAAGSTLDGVLEIPFGAIVPLFHLEDPAPLPGGTVGLGVAWTPGVDPGEQHTHFDRVMVRRVADPAAVDARGPDAEAPAARRVAAAPNPTRGAVSFAFGGPAPERLELLDLNGRLVRALEPAPGAAAGSSWRLEWDGRDARGCPVASGVYAWRLCPAGKAAGAEVRGRVTVMR
ncbi:MAG: hypothetical protein V1774_10165, partial [Candidatus Eisenbacteria bacterium]